jgi:hypothetical protein
MSPVSTPSTTYGCQNHSHANSGWRVQRALRWAAAPPFLIPLDPLPFPSILLSRMGLGTRAGEGSFDRCWRIDPLHPRHSINKHGQPHPVCVFIPLALTRLLPSINLPENIKCLAENLRKNYNNAFGGHVYIP